MKHYLTIAILTCLTLSFVLAGCEKKADENAPIPQVNAQAEKMNVDQLRAAAMEYKKAIEAKKTDVDKIMAEIKNIPVTESAEKIKNLKPRLDEINKSISALAERQLIFINKLKEKGGDISGLSL